MKFKVGEKVFFERWDTAIFNAEIIGAKKGRFLESNKYLICYGTVCPDKAVVTEDRLWKVSE